MDRRTVERAALAALAIIAIAAAAATLPSARESAGDGTGSGPPAAGSGEGSALPTPDPAPVITFHVPGLARVMAVLAVLVLLVVLAYAVFYRREMVRILAGFAAVMILLLAVYWLVSMIDPATPSMSSNGSVPVAEPGGSAGDQTRAPRPLALLLVLGVVGVAVAAMLVRSGTGGSEEEVPTDGEPSADAVAVGRAAGRAADRIEETDDLDNEIYRAWREMTGLLDVSAPEASTPGEFAAAAVDAGMDRDDVGELTRLFEDVRYGGDEPTEDSERRALGILRRIEETYSPEGEEEP